MSESRSKYALYSFLDDLADSLKTWQQLVKDADGKDVPPLAFAYMSQAYANAKALHVISLQKGCCYHGNAHGCTV